MQDSSVMQTAELVQQLLHCALRWKDCDTAVFFPNGAVEWREGLLSEHTERAAPIALSLRATLPSH